MIEFIAHRFPTIMDGLVIRHKFINEYDRFQINSSRNGVCIIGLSPTIQSKEDIDKIKSVIDECWEEHIKIKSGEIK